MRACVKISFLVAALTLSGVATFSCRTDGTVDLQTVSREATLNAATLRDVAVIYEEEQPELAADLRQIADLADAVAQALANQSGDGWQGSAQAALDLAGALLAEQDDPDIQAALVLLRAGLARAMAYAPSS
jgi:hypothetical protein